MKILVADDNLFYRTMVEATLAEWGYEAVPVADGEEAWQQLQQPGGPPIALLDWMMPRLDGLEVCRLVRGLNRPEPTYLILLTAKDGKADLVRGLQNGADDYISKPFDREELRARLQTALRIVDLQANLAARIKELEHALSAGQKLEFMGRLAGGVAHDFNNLLTVILGGCELLLHHSPSAPTPVSSNGDIDGYVKKLTMIKDAGERGAALTRQLLAFSSAQVLKPTEVDLNAIVAGACGLLRRLIPEDIAMETVKDRDAGFIRADPGQIEQVLMNLIVNARDAMPGGGMLTIETKKVSVATTRAGVPGPVPSGTYMLCRVTDTGCGISEEIRTRIFEPFFTTKEPGRGTGLGLATVYGVVKQSDAFIQFESDLGRGTTFTLYFPAVAAPAEPHAVKSGLHRLKPVLSNAIRTVLLVEDEDAVRAIASSSLADRQYTVLEARDGDEALALSRRWPHPIDLLVTDVVMPRMNGRELAERLASERPHMRVLFMSGYTDEAMLQRAVHYASVPFLQKPFAPEALLGKIDDLLS